MKLRTKIKLHLLVCAPEDIRRFGPLVGSITEQYERYNSVFRAFSKHSNRLAPSRDISCQLNGMSVFKHIATGGYWVEHEVHICASPQLLKFCQEWPVISDRLGWPLDRNASPGSQHLVSLLSKYSLMGSFLRHCESSC
jgi:hypothetical protein